MLENYNYKRLVVGQLETNCYLLYHIENRKCIILDPGGEPGKIISQVERLDLIPKFVVLTHAHTDHCGATIEISQKYKIPTLMSEKDLDVLHSDSSIILAQSLGLNLPEKIDILIDNEEFKIQYFENLKILFTPGHTPGSISLKLDNLLFTGDTIFAGSIGRTDLLEGNYKTIQESIERIKKLPLEIKILPGHGEETDLKTEIQTNPFF